MISMNKQTVSKPVVLVLAGHDPSGGAGIQADIETLAVHQCITTSVITSLTAQNTQSFVHCLPQTMNDFLTQGRLILADIKIDACKIGVIGSSDLVRAISTLIVDKSFPVVLDPVLQSTTGNNFADEEICHLLCELILPLTTIITPNREEAMQLTGKLAPLSAAEKMLEMGCKNVLITDAEDSQTEVINHLYQVQGEPQTFTYRRLPGSYHGSGCTLSSSISANLAKDITLISAIEQAQEYTWNCLKNGLQLGNGQLHPNRFYRD